jgi:mono/diheme cytochrome c family protein
MAKIFTFLTVAFLVFFFSAQAQVNNPWEVPEEYQKMENPVEANKTTLKSGKSLYNQHCKTCHGKKGMGDGSISKNLEEDPSDLTLVDLDIQQDGELYYKILKGHEEMPSYDVLLEEKDIWLLVNYIRTFYSEQ